MFVTISEPTLTRTPLFLKVRSCHQDSLLLGLNKYIMTSIHCYIIQNGFTANYLLLKVSVALLGIGKIRQEAAFQKERKYLPLPSGELHSDCQVANDLSGVAKDKPG